MGLNRAEQERDLYLRLLELGHEQELAPLLEQALKLAVDATGALRGYIELYSDTGQDPKWAIAQGCSEQDVAEIRAVTSRGIVGRALATGETIHTPSALLDARFSEQASVRLQRIEAVICVPVGGQEPIGVLYLQGRKEASPFTEADVHLVEIFAQHMAPAASRLLQLERSRREHDPTRSLREKLGPSNHEVVGRSEALSRVLEQVTLVVPLDVTVLLTGPSGTGKTQVAQLIHQNSGRKSRPFVELSCAALQETLLESELFGAHKGSHATAYRTTEGKVAAAEGGTLFLDEIGDLAAGSQAKLLQLLQSKSYYPLGSTKAITANIRVIAATHHDLEELVRTKRFRDDLYYRLNVVPIRLPPLSERPEDIVMLAEHFVQLAGRQHGLPKLELSPSARYALTSAEWPGNIRQLSNTVSAGLIRAAGDGAAQIEQRHLFPQHPETNDRDAPQTFQQATRRWQRAFLEQTLNDTNWSVVEAAKRLDLTRSHVYALIRAHGLAR